MINIIIILAVWRLTNLFVYEDGPWYIFDRLRVYTERYNWINLECFRCASVWVALPYSFLTDNWPIYWFFFSAGSILIEIIVEYLEKDV